MTDNPTYRGNPGEENLDDQYGRPQEERAGGQDQQRAAYPQDQGYPPSYEKGYQGRAPYEQGGYYGQPGYGQGYEQRPPAGGYNPPPPGYDQGYRGYPGQGGQPYGPPPGGGYGPPAGDYDYGRQAPGRYDDPGYGPSQGRHESRPPYPDQPGYQQGYGAPYGRPEYGPPPGYGGYPAPAAPDYDYGPQAGQPAAGGYTPQDDYSSAGHAIILQLDDGSGRTYQLREGANVIGRGQEAQFRLPDTGVSRRHLEIRWDGQVALLSDLNSTNGTTVNNAPVQEWQLADGDVIRLGHSEIIVHVR